MGQTVSLLRLPLTLRATLALQNARSDGVTCWLEKRYLLDLKRHLSAARLLQTAVSANICWQLKLKI